MIVVLSIVLFANNSILSNKFVNEGQRVDRKKTAFELQKTKLLVFKSCEALVVEEFLKVVLHLNCRVGMRT